MATFLSEREAIPTLERRVGIIDCDVHPGPKSVAEIKAHMPMPFRDRWNGGGRGFFGNPMHGENLLMFSSDYPHWDFDSPAHAFPKLPEALHHRIFEANARAWYGL